MDACGSEKETDMKTIALNRKLAGTLAVAALTTTVLPAAPADAGTPRCILRFSAAPPLPDGRARTRVTHNCPRLSPGDQMVYIVIWGDDWPDSDDRLYLRRTHILNDSYVVDEITLNEDLMTGDELYMVARFKRPNGIQYDLKSGVERGEFSPFD
jgi:hypothetical protein